MIAASLVLVSLFPFGVLGQRQRVTTDATCGGSKGYTCLGSRWGNCCSQYGWCGSTTDYCGKGCNPQFGSCNGGTVSSHSLVKVSTSSSTKTSSATPASSTKPAATQPVTTDARCGPSFGGQTCLGSQWGDCCSQYSYCGSTLAYCDAKTCQKGFGKCNTISSSSKASSSASTTQSASLSSFSSSFSSSISISSSDSKSTSSISPSPSASSSLSPEPSLSPSTSLEASSSPSPTPDASPPPSPEASPSPTPEASPSPTPEASPSPTPEASPSPSSSPSPEASPSLSPSSTPEASPSPTPPVSPSPTPEASTSPSPSSTTQPPAVCTFKTVPTCEPFSGALANSCPASNLRCQSGFQINCGRIMRGLVITPNPPDGLTAEECVATCAALPACVAANYRFTGGTLQCSLRSVGTLLDSSNPAQNYIAFVRVCDSQSPAGRKRNEPIARTLRSVRVAHDT